MNPGPVEEIGKTGRGVVNALQPPILLMLTILQFATLSVILWTTHERNAYETKLNEMLLSVYPSK